ncbi:hypothetical protein [Microbulbifer spongiae]|uniref:Uncharacterized protein n=1 Tax=Microbulbifer spongiae TaxID=2944933 RepID=A0ABY9E8E4_9GAMM|nr:hypothetical protein [Microbulbifer sp. MI-G]WKD48378.1 hypothetical protein M8T91_10570 [Microbulbifer sp. MI-G]
MGNKKSLLALIATLTIITQPSLTWADDLHEREATKRCLKTCKEIYYNCIGDNQKVQNICVSGKIDCDNICRDNNKEDFYDNEYESEYDEHGI